MPNVSPEEFEKIMLAADDIIKKSRGFMLFVVNHKGDFQSISYFGELDSMQQLGLARAANRITDISEDSILSTYDYNDKVVGEDDGQATDEDDGEPI